LYISSSLVYEVWVRSLHRSSYVPLTVVNDWIVDTTSAILCCRYAKTANVRARHYASPWKSKLIPSHRPGSLPDLVAQLGIQNSALCCSAKQTYGIMVRKKIRFLTNEWVIDFGNRHNTMSNKYWPYYKSKLELNSSDAKILRLCLYLFCTLSRKLDYPVLF